MKKISGFKVFASLIVVVVLAVIVYAIVISGSPKEQRERQFDDQRVNALSQISSSVNTYYTTNRALPNSLEQLALQPYYINSLTDPKTGEKYEYNKKSDTSYELCAIFSFAADEKNNPSYASPKGYMQMWKHDAGRHCFGLDAKTGVIYEQMPMVNTCVLMQDKETGKVDCFGCANGACKTPSENFSVYPATSTKGTVGISYSCYITDNGCALAQ